MCMEIYVDGHDILWTYYVHATHGYRYNTHMEMMCVWTYIYNIHIYVHMYNICT